MSDKSYREKLNKVVEEWNGIWSSGADEMFDLCRELIAENKQLKDVKKRAEKAWMALDDISVFGDIPIGEKP